MDTDGHESRLSGWQSSIGAADGDKYVITLALIPAFSPGEKGKRLPRLSRIKPLDWSDGWTNCLKTCQGKALSLGRGLGEGERCPQPFRLMSELYLTLYQRGKLSVAVFGLGFQLLRRLNFCLTCFVKICLPLWQFVCSRYQLFRLRQLLVLKLLVQEPSGFARCRSLHLEKFSLIPVSQLSEQVRLTEQRQSKIGSMLASGRTSRSGLILTSFPSCKETASPGQTNYGG